jgi:hypothetical protein
MSDQQVELAAHVVVRLVKWDGDDPGEDPIGHPQCVEVIELEDGESRILYRREQ